MSYRLGLFRDLSVVGRALRSVTRPVAFGRRCGWRLVLLVGLVIVTGCGVEADLERAYGQRRGSAVRSVNGTSLLAAMFQDAGFSPTTHRQWTPDLKRYDTVVWAPDSFGLPDESTCRFLDDWLAASGKTLVFIGRDYDAAGDYWEQVLPNVPEQQRLEVLRQLARVRAVHEQRRVRMPAQGVGEWFVMRRDRPLRRAGELNGPWAEGVEASRAEIWTRGLLEPPVAESAEDAELSRVSVSPQCTVLLQDGDRALVSRVTKPTWGTSQVLVVTNGSFLLNLPLVNAEHQKLARRLMRACGPPGRVAFVESGPSDPPVWDRSPRQGASTMSRERLWIVIHWLVLGLVYCFSIFPIFGRARSEDTRQQPEFAQHIDALAAMLRKTRDGPFARRQVDEYRESARRAASRRPAAEAAEPAGHQAASTHQEA